MFATIIPLGYERDIEYLRTTVYRVRSWGGHVIIVSSIPLESHWSKWARVIVDEKLGATRARVVGIEEVIGKYNFYVFLDSDAVPQKIPKPNSVMAVRQIVNHPLGSLISKFAIVAHGIYLDRELYIIGATKVSATNTCCISVDENYVNHMLDILKSLPDGIYAEMFLATHATGAITGVYLTASGIVDHYNRTTVYGWYYPAGKYEAGMKYFCDTFRRNTEYYYKYGTPKIIHDGLEIALPPRFVCV